MFNCSLVPNLVDGARIQIAEMMLGWCRFFVDVEILPSRKTAVCRHKSQGEPKTLLKLFPE